MALLEIRNLGIQFGGLRALTNFNFSLEQGELVALIGPNGAGKTTAFNIATGIYAPSSGSVSLDGHELAGLPAHAINRRGLARTFQNIRLFSSLSVLDNVQIGFTQEITHGFWGTLLQSPQHHLDEKQHRQQALALLEVMGLESVATALAGSLSYGLRRRLEIARAMATSPRILCLDEPAAGMNPKEKEELTELVRSLCAQFKIGIWLIEHDMKLVMSLAQRITVLDHGETIAVGSPEQIRGDARVIEAYLGES